MLLINWNVHFKKFFKCDDTIYKYVITYSTQDDYSEFHSKKFSLLSTEKRKKKWRIFSFYFHGPESIENHRFDKIDGYSYIECCYHLTITV